ncbi:hypothetical protein TA3x_002785 [Tundrisphaera sp. TA3]|uniref:hypothetical protein n=1 Tax=Tundrisphaera sp. TA3 TaxID=3435775 RepID=UPI003EBD6225
MNPTRLCVYLTLITLLHAPAMAPAAEPWSGIYPHLAMFNEGGECGTGAVVPWAGRLWAVTYSPHSPAGSADKLYEIDDQLRLIVRPESIGGTPANRMIHRESNQLFIGPYAIDGDRRVRAIPYSRMYGRPTGNARHLTDPAGKIYYASMEEGFYEVDVKTLDVKELWTDEQKKGGHYADLPGYHGKGFYSGQGRMVYANNGEHGPAALKDPTIASGILAQWDGKAPAWDLVRRNQFTEVTGPGGIFGNDHPETDPIWTIGWDPRSLILMVLHEGKWTSYRLPKASLSYDGAHGWDTEWPRIREIGEDDLLMTMHGMFWHFPRDFRPGHTSGIAPRSSYLKVIGDFCRWNDKVVLGCDDAAQAEFTNVSRVKGKIGGPGQSQSNLVFLDPAQLDGFGPALGRGAVWLRDKVEGGRPSDPYLFQGFRRRTLTLSHGSKGPVTFTIQTDGGDGRWTTRRTESVQPGEATWIPFDEQEPGAWIRVIADRDVDSATAVFRSSNPDPRTSAADPIFAGIATTSSADYLAGVLRARGDNLRTLAVGAAKVEAGSVVSKGFYELGADMILRPSGDTSALAALEKAVPVNGEALQRDAASVLIVDDQGKRWRLPSDLAYAGPPAASLKVARRLDRNRDFAGPPGRVAREVVTERNILNADGTFYELPAGNAGGFAGLRAIATHGRRVADFASYRGLMVMTGIDPAGAKENRHLIRSEDGRAAVWVGSIDDLWRFGKPVGVGGPWKDTIVAAGVPSDPYILTGFDRKRVLLAHNAGKAVRMRVEVEVAGNDHWIPYRTLDVPPGKAIDFAFPPDFDGNWVRVVADADCVATAQFTYE